MQIKLLVEGGSMSPGPALSQQLGPAGINIGQVISKVNDATKEFKGLKVPVQLDVDTGTKEFEVKVFSPPVSELLKKEIGIEKGSGIQSKFQVGNASIEQIISVAKTKQQNLLAKDLKAAVKSVLGTCTSLGLLVESKSPIEVGQEVDEGKYDKEISEEITETPEGKRKELDDYYKTISTQQQKALKEEEAAKAAEEEAAAQAAAAPAEGKEEEKAATPTPAAESAGEKATPAKK